MVRSRFPTTINVSRICARAGMRGEAEEGNMNRMRSAAVGIGKLLCAGLIATASTQAAFAADIHIKMLRINPIQGRSRSARALPKRTRATHWFSTPCKWAGTAPFGAVPPGAQAWTGAPDKETRVTLDTEGVYLYVCAAHKMMGMAGVVLVGNPVNLQEAKAVADKESSKFVLNKDRFEKELAQIE